MPRRSLTSTLVCSPPTPLRHRPRLRLSLAVGLPGCKRFSEPAPRAFADAGASVAFGFGSTVAPTISQDRSGSPRLLDHPRPTRHGHPLRRLQQRLTHSRCCCVLPSGIVTPWADREQRYFGADSPVAHRLACLRIHPRVAALVARLATDLPGWALVGRDLHPLDDKRNFVTYRMVTPFRPALPGRTTNYRRAV